MSVNTAPCFAVIISRAVRSVGSHTKAEVESKAASSGFAVLIINDTINVSNPEVLRGS